MSNNNQSDKKPKQFDVKVEFLVPTTITYRVTAENEQEALKEVDKFSARRLAAVPHNNKKIKLKAAVYRINSNMMKLSKTYRQI